MISSTNLLSKLYQYLIVFILLITFLAYSNIFSNQFIGDDFDFFVDWPLTQSLAGVHPILQGANPPQHIGNYRPLKNLTILVTRQLFGDWMPGYHLISLSTHLSITLLVYLIVHKVSNHKPLSLLSSLFFGLHPLHTEAVTFLTASYDTIGFAFALLAFYSYLHSHSIGHNFTRRNFILPDYPTALLLISFIFNETTLIFPFLIALHYWLYRTNTSFSLTPIKQLLHATKTYFLIAIVYYLFRTLILQVPTRGSYQAHNLLLSLLVSLKATVEYLRTFIWPIPLSTSHTLPGGIVSYTYQKYNLTAVQAQSLTDLAIIIGLIILGCIVLAITLFRHSRPLLSFSLGWIILSLLPVINLLPTALIFSERYAYLSSIGFCMLLGFFATSLYRRFKPFLPLRYLLLASILWLLSFYFYQTYTRNLAWRNETVFWIQETSLHPNNPLMHLILGRVHQKNFRLAPAIQAYQQAASLAPDLYETYYHLGTIYQFQQDYPAAIQAYLQALSYQPDHPESRHNLLQICLDHPLHCE